MLLEYVEKLKESDVLSEDLFEELFSIEDEFEREKKHQEIQIKARELKLLTQFNKLYSAYQKANKKELMLTDAPSYITQFNGQPELKTGMWRASMDGIWILTERGKEYACSHPIYPKTILVNVENHTCKVELVFLVRNKWEHIFVDRKVIASRTSIVALANHGIRVTSENAGLLVRFLSDVEALNEETITESLSTSRLGWVVGESLKDSYFLPFEKGIVFDNENNVGNLYASISEMGHYSTWIDIVKTVRKQKRIEPLMGLATSFASVLVEPLGILPFIIGIWGGTGKGKTVTLKLATSIWANPFEGQYITDAKTTVTAMEIRLDVLNNLPMIVDDLSQLKGKTEGDFGDLIYMLCSGSSKGRATKEAGLKQTSSWRNSIFATSEHSFTTETSQAGAINRVIEIECGNVDIYTDPNGHDLCEVLHRNYGHAGKAFIEAVKTIDSDGIQELYKKYYDLLIKEMQTSGIEKELKQIIPMTVILVADEISEKYIFKDGIRLDVGTCFKLLKSKNDISEGIRTYRYLMDTVASSKFRFEEPHLDDPERFERWGKFMGDNKVAIIGKFFDKMISEAGSNTKAFLSWAKSVDIVDKDKNGNAKKNVNILGSSPRCVVIRMDWDIEEQQDDGKFMDIPNNIQEEIPF